MDYISALIALVVGLGVFVIFLIVLRSLWMWLLGINEVLAVLRDIRDRLPEPARRTSASAAPSRSSPALPTSTNPLR